MNFLFTFKTFVDVFSCERISKAAGLSCHIVPVPRSLDISCEYAAEFQNIDESDFCTILELLKKNDLPHIRVFHSCGAVDGEMY